MSEPTTLSPTSAGSTELFENDPIESAEQTPPESPAETPPATETPPVPEVPPAPETPPVPEPPAPQAAQPPAEPEKPQKSPSWSELRALRQQLEEKEKLLQQLIGRQPAQPQAAPQPGQPEAPKPPPDPNEDPVGFMQWQQEQIVMQQNALAQQNWQMQQRQQAIELQGLINTQIQDFSAKQADYRDAAQYLEGREIARWKAMGYTDAEAVQATQQRALQVVAGALQLGRSVPEVLYEIAMADGWARPDATPAPNGAPPATGPVTPAQKVEASKAKSAVAATSMGSVGGTPTPGKTLTKAQIRGMTEEQLEETFGRDDWQSIVLQDE